MALSIKSYPTYWNVIREIAVEAGLAEPFSWSCFGAALWSHGLALAGLAALLLGVYGAGHPVVGLVGLSGTVASVLRLACGWGLISLINHGLGLTGLYFPAILRAEAGVLPVLGLSWMIRNRAWQRSFAIRRSDRLPAVAVLLILAGAFLLGRLPDVHEDARQGHLAGPEQYLLLHKIEAETQHMAWHMARGAEMVNLVPWHLAGIDGAKQVNVGWLITLALVVTGLGKTLGGGGWWGTMLAISAGLVMSEAWEGKNDLGQTAGTAGALWCGMRAMVEKSKGRWWLAAAWLMGSAMGVKYTTGFFVVGLAATAWTRKVRVDWGRMALVTGVFVAPFIGWMWESWLFVGNPVYPFMSGTIPTLGWGPFYERAMHDLIGRLSPEGARKWWDVLSGTWRVTGDPGTGNPALFAVLPLALLGRRRRGAGYLLALTAVSWVLWGTTERTARYMYVAGVVVGVLGGLALEESKWTRSRAVRYTLVGTALWYAGMTWAIMGGAGSWQILLGTKGRDAYLAGKYTTWWDAVKWLNGNVPAGGRVCFTGENRRLWLSMRVRSCAVVAEPLFWRLTKDSYTAGQVRKRVKQLGLTHQLHNFVSAEYRGLMWYAGPAWADRQFRVYTGFVRAYLKPVRVPDRIDYNNGGFYIFEYARKPGSFPLYYLPSTEGCFQDSWSMLSISPPAQTLAKAEGIAAKMKGVAEAEQLLATFYTEIGNYARVNELLEPGYRSGFVGDGSIEAYAESSHAIGRLATAQKALCRAFLLTRNPSILHNMSYVFYKRAKVAAARGDIARAARDMEQAAFCDPREAAPSFELARILKKLGRVPEAIYWVRKARTLMPDNPDGAALAIELESRIGRGGE